MAKLFDLSGKVAIVTGGNGGIGLGMATGLAEAGATIVIAARDAEKNAKAVAASSLVFPTLAMRQRPLHFSLRRAPRSRSSPPLLRDRSPCPNRFRRYHW